MTTISEAIDAAVALQLSLDEVLRRGVLDELDYYVENKIIKPPFIPGETSIPASGKILGKREYRNLVSAAMEGWLTEGHWVDEFEAAFRKYIGCRTASMVNSGSSANLLALSALTSHELGERRLKPGDEVITTAAGFPTTINPILQNGLVPVFVDVDLGTYVPNVEQIEHAIGPKTKAIMLAHTLGNTWPVDHFQGKDIWIIEDNCDALGSRIGGKRTGSFGDLATQSFYPAHHITTGEGGMVLTNNGRLKKIVESFRDWGRDCWCDPGKEDTCNKRFDWEWERLPDGYDHKYVYSHIGYNMKSTDLQASVGVAQLERMPAFEIRRKENFQYLLEGLMWLEYIFVMPEPSTMREDICWFGFPLTIRPDAGFELRELEMFLSNRKIGTRRLFAGNYMNQPAMMHWYEDGNHAVSAELTKTNLIAERSFWIGLWPGITKPMLDYVIESIHDFVETR
jgi:CDP-6-deoxy-D-xylo-4-hexulose-3-dehydrase